MTTNKNQLIEEIKESYHDYALKLEGGVMNIVNSLKSNNTQEGIAGIQALSEGITWMLDTESLLEAHSFKSNSPIQTISPLFEKINAALAVENFEQVSELLEIELLPMLKDAKDWTFEEVIS
jgi:hypothetical protein